MSVVTDDMVQAALDAYSENEWRTSASAMRAALAAVVPLIAAQERERCAKVADEVATLRSVPSNKWVASEIAAAIRSLGDEA